METTVPELATSRSPEELSPEELNSYIQHVYNLGYAKGLTDNIEQWEKALENAFSTYAEQIAIVYKKTIVDNDIEINDIYYNYNSSLREINILLVLPDEKFESSYPLINKENIFYKNVIGSKFGCNIYISCMSDYNFNEETIECEYTKIS